jgi:hypothetical protein
VIIYHPWQQINPILVRPESAAQADWSAQGHARDPCTVVEFSVQMQDALDPTDPIFASKVGQVIIMPLTPTAALPPLMSTQLVKAL